VRDLAPTLLGILGLMIAAVAPIVVARNQRRQQDVDEPHKMIDQLQKERTADRQAFTEERSSLQQRMGRLERRNEDQSTQIRVLWDYVLQLRYFIATDQPGPPPTLPEGMKVLGRGD
jgi:hypothetical protein